jgi:hypothetical protein
MKSSIRFVHTTQVNQQMSFYCNKFDLLFKRERCKLSDNVENDIYFNQASGLNQSQRDICCSEQKTDESQVEFNVFTELIVNCIEFEDIISFFTIVQITELNVSDDLIFVRTLIDLLSHFPHLNTLSVCSLSFCNSDSLLSKKIHTILRYRKITKSQK